MAVILTIITQGMNEIKDLPIDFVHQMILYNNRYNVFAHTSIECKQDNKVVSVTEYGLNYSNKLMNIKL